MTSLYLRTSDLVKIIGTDATVCLCTALGGLSGIYVPQPARLNPDHRLVRAVGMSAAQTLASIFGGEYVEIPKGSTLGKRKREIYRMSEQGVPHNLIARRTGVTERYVRMITSDGAPRQTLRDERQQDLFDAA